MRSHPNSPGNQLRELGLRVTQSRLLVLTQIAKEVGRSHSGESIHARLSRSGNDISIATVYRVMSDFEKAGLLSRRFVEGGRSLFSLKTADPLSSLVCLGCGRVQEFTDEPITPYQRGIGTQAGFSIRHRESTLFGHCADCQKRQSAKVQNQTTNASHPTERLRSARLLTVRRRLKRHSR